MLDAPSSVVRYREDQAEVDLIWARYAELLIGAARSGLFDVLAHLDLPKKFGFRATHPFAGRQSEVVSAVAASGCAVELSSAGRRKPVGRGLPGPGPRARAGRRRGGFVLSSDAHAPAEVGYAFDELAANTGRQGSRRWWSSGAAGAARSRFDTRGRMASRRGRGAVVLSSFGGRVEEPT